jgi:hypothetical protein
MNRTHKLLSWFLLLQIAPQFHAGDVILFIDEVHTLIGSGIAGRGSKGAGLDIANLLKPALARGELQVTFSQKELLWLNLCCPSCFFVLTMATFLNQKGRGFSTV